MQLFSGPWETMGIRATPPIEHVPYGLMNNININEPQMYDKVVVLDVAENRNTGLELQKTQDRRGDIMVAYVWRNGVAGKAGLKIGDIVSQVNGRKPECVEEVHQALREKTPTVLTLISFQ